MAGRRRQSQAAVGDWLLFMIIGHFSGPGRALGLSHIDSEIVCMAIRLHYMPREVTHVLMGVAYCPPGSNNSVMTDHLLGCLDQYSSAHTSAGIILLGDFNQLSDAPLCAYPLNQMVASSTWGVAMFDKIFH